MSAFTAWPRASGASADSDDVSQSPAAGSPEKRRATRRAETSVAELMNSLPPAAVPVAVLLAVGVKFAVAPKAGEGAGAKTTQSSSGSALPSGWQSVPTRTRTLGIIASACMRMLVNR